MKIDHNATLMRIYLSESARHGHHDMLTAIVEAIAGAGMEGATAFKGIEGFGSSRVVSSDRAVDAWVDLPIVIEVVDDEQKIAGFIPALESILGDGLVTVERVQTIFCRTEGSAAQ